MPAARRWCNARRCACCRRCRRSRPSRCARRSRTLCAIWIRLSSLTPSPITVSSQRAAVDAGVGADLDVVADAHRAQLLDLLPAALGGREAEAVGADDRAAVQDAARADAAALADHHLRRQPRVLADHGMRADVAVRPDHHAAADDRAGARHAPAHRCWPAHAPAPRARPRRSGWTPGGAGWRALRAPTTGSAARSTGRGRRVTMALGRAPRASRSAGRDDHAAGGRRLQLRAVARVGRESDVVPAPAASSERDAAQHELGIAEQFTAQLRDQFAAADLEHPGLRSGRSARCGRPVRR